MTLARVVLALSAVTFAGLGLWSLTTPEQVAGTVDLAFASPTGRADFMAFYGGFELGFAAFLATCLRRADRVPAGLAAVAFGLGFAGFGRLAGMLTAAGPVKPLMTGFLVAEVAGAALCAWCLRRLSRP